MIVAPELSSAKPYLLRAMYEWCCDQGVTPYISVFVDEQVQVPMEFVRHNEITLNVGMDATNSLLINNETLEFKARFGGTPRHVMVPITHVMAIYGRENGQGMAFPITEPTQMKPQEVSTALLPMTTPSKLATTPTMKKEKIKPKLTIVRS
jgi:stringent starvation protein B